MTTFAHDRVGSTPKLRGELVVRARTTSSRSSSWSRPWVLAPALELREAALGPEHPKLGYPLVALAELALARQRLEDAITLSERALEIRVAKPSASENKARPRFALARPLWERDGAGDLERARSPPRRKPSSCP